MRRPENHGKCACDSAAKIPKLIVKSGTISGDILAPGTNALVRYLAKRDNFIPPDLQNNSRNKSEVDHIH